jgi:hypothetical protein
VRRPPLARNGAGFAAGANASCQLMETQMNRREFLETVAAAVPALGWQGTPANEWGSPVFDLHFHLRPQPAANLAHLDGAGIRTSCSSAATAAAATVTAAA